MLKLSKQVIYNKIEQCLVSIPGDFVIEKHVRLIMQCNQCGKLNAELLDQWKCRKTGCWNLITNEKAEKCVKVELR